MKKSVLLSFLLLSTGSNSFGCDYETYDTTIVGAGLSGLNAARTILQKNPQAKIHILEARDRVGGRTFTQDGVELGGEFVDKDHYYTLNILKELGLETNGIKADGDVFLIEDGQRFDLNKMKPLFQSLIVKLESAFKKIQPDAYTKWDSAQGKHLFTPLGSSLEELTNGESRILSAIVQDEYGIALEDATLSSIGSWIERLKEYQELVDAKTNPIMNLGLRFCSFANIDLATINYRIQGGTASLCKALMKDFPKGMISYSSPVTKIARQKSGAYEIDATSRVIHSNNVIISTPFSVLRERKILDKSLGLNDEVHSIIDTKPYGRNGKVIVPCSLQEKIIYFIDMDNKTAGWGNMSGLTFIDTNVTDKTDKKAEITKSVFEAKIEDNIIPIAQDWGSDPYSLGCWSTLTAGTPYSMLSQPSETLAGLQQFAGPHNDKTLFFIGEHTCDGQTSVKENNGEAVRTGYMQSALYSGFVVGNYIAQ